MLVCEDNLRRAIDVFLEGARIPRPKGWSVNMDRAKVDYSITLAFLKALEEIDRVDLCAGFDINKVH